MGEAPTHRVLLVCGPLQFSSWALQTLNLARGLIRRGVGICLVTPGGPMVPQFQQLGIPMEVRRLLAIKVLEWFQVRELVKVLRPQGFQLVHALHEDALGLADQLARRLDLPVVATIHQSQVEQPLALSPRVQTVFTHSEAVRVSLVNERKVKKERVRTLVGGVDLERFRLLAPLPEERRVLPVVGTLGPLQRGRGLDLFLTAAHRLREQQQERVHFLIIGEGAFRRDLDHTLRTLSLHSAVTFAAGIPYQVETLEALDICVFPSPQETPAPWILEAMAAGRAVVATGVGGVYSIIQDGESGLIVRPNDADALVEALTGLLSDPVRCAGLGQRARETVREQFALEEMVDEMLGSYARLLRQLAESTAG